MNELLTKTRLLRHRIRLYISQTKQTLPSLQILVTTLSEYTHASRTSHPRVNQNTITQITPAVILVNNGRLWS